MTDDDVLTGQGECVCNCVVADYALDAIILSRLFCLILLTFAGTDLFVWHFSFAPVAMLQYFVASRGLVYVSEIVPPGQRVQRFGRSILDGFVELGAELDAEEFALEGSPVVQSAHGLGRTADLEGSAPRVVTRQVSSKLFELFDGATLCFLEGELLAGEPCYWLKVGDVGKYGLAASLDGGDKYVRDKRPLSEVDSEILVPNEVLVIECFRARLRSHVGFKIQWSI